MPEGLKAQQVRNIFFPKRKHFTFHRINLEYLVPLQSMQRRNIYSLLDAGLRNNLKNQGNSDEILRSLRPQIEGLASRVSVQGARLLRERKELRAQCMKRHVKDFPLYRASMSADCASRKLSESLLEQSNDAFQQILTAEHMLLHALQVNEQDYQAQFELGWVYLFLLGRLEEAEQHFQMAVDNSRECDPQFSVFALRHLADAHYSLDKHSNAIEAGLMVLRETPLNDLEYVYECARYMAAGGEVELATHRLAEVVKQSPVYYVQAQVEPDFNRHEIVHDLLRDLREVRVKRIQHYVRQSWREHYLSEMALPDNIDSRELFHQTYRQHKRVMAHLPYVTLSQRERHIGDLIIQASEKRVTDEVRKRSRQYEQHVEKRSKRWVWVNKLGAICLHTAMVLFLSCIMFLVVRFLVGSSGMPGLMGTNDIVGDVFNAFLALLISGALLVQFVPWGTRKLLFKQVELDNTLRALTTKA